MIIRMWHGRVPQAKALAYREFLTRVALPDYRAVDGNLGVDILECAENDVVHFVTLTKWTDLKAIERFAGANFQRARYYPVDGEFLLEFEPNVEHYRLVGSDT